MGESVDLKARGIRVVVSVPDGARTAREPAGEGLGMVSGTPRLQTGMVRPFSTASWRERVERAVTAAEGEKTLVLCTGGRAERGAMRLLPQLPGRCFVPVGDFTGAALRRAVEHGITQVVFVGMAGQLTELASGVSMPSCARSRVDTDLLAEITTAMGGSPELAGQVAGAGTARHAYELWEADGLLGRAGRELCRRVAGVLERFAAEAAPERPGIAAQVVLVDFTGQRMIAMYGRLGR